jgi:hypothetical protein
LISLLHFTCHHPIPRHFHHFRQFPVNRAFRIIHCRMSQLLLYFCFIMRTMANSLHLISINFKSVKPHFYLLDQRLSNCGTGTPWGTRNAFQGYHKSSFICIHTALIKCKLWAILRHKHTHILSAFKINITKLYYVISFLSAIQMCVVYFPSFFCMGYQTFLWLH